MQLMVGWLNKDHPVLIADNDVRVDIYQSDEDNAYVVQITTSEETDSWETLRVYLNDGEAKEWV